MCIVGEGLDQGLRNDGLFQGDIPFPNLKEALFGDGEGLVLLVLAYSRIDVGDAVA